MIKKIILTILIILFFVPSIYAERFYTTQEVIASVIAAEARGEGKKGLYAVANTIANRAKKYNKTPYEIVTQKNQFYGYTSKNRETLYLQCKEYADYLTKNILELKDITKGALYFRRFDEKKQEWHLTKLIQIGNHIFYR